MFFDNIPVITLGQFLNSSLDLFSLAMQTVFGQPVLGFFVAVALFLVIVSLFAWLIHQGKSGRL